MRRILISAFAVVTALTIGLTSVPVRAADAASELTDDQVMQIKQNCKQAQSVLQRLQTTDVATRINRGRIYENLLNNLIAPFDSRVSLNRYDASMLTLQAATLNQKFTNFKNDYVTYADSYSSLLSINCESDPRGFYNLLSTTRTLRGKVSTDISDLNTALDSYSSAFVSLRQDVDGN